MTDVKDDDPNKWTQGTYWPHGKWVCTECENRRNPKSYVQTRDADTGETRYNTVCTPCRSIEEQTRYKKEMAEAVAERQATRERKKELNKEFGQRVKERHKRHRKEKREATKIERELAEREMARRSLLAYVERHKDGYEAGWVHEDICRRLEKFMHDVEMGKSPRLMLWVPPRHGKSEISSVQFPGWVLGHHPEWEFMSTSYSVDLPLGFSRSIRARIKSEEHRALFPDLHLAKDSQSAESWRTTRGGGYRAAGVGGGITGMGAHIFIIDDPVKDATEADSETTRRTVKSWFGSTAYTRLAPGGGMLVIQTRWHDDDLSGWLETQMREAYRELSEMKAELLAMKKDLTRRREYEEYRKTVAEFEASIDRWEIVKYPAVATHDEYLDPVNGKIFSLEGTTKSESYLQRCKLLRRAGDALHPERFNKTLLSKYKRTMEPRHWSALYQQNPIPDEGLYFTKDIITLKPTPPPLEDMNIYVAWDLAISSKNEADWTVGIVAGHDWEDNIWILDMIRGKWMTHQIAENIVSTHKRYDAVQTGIEKGQLEHAIRPSLEKIMAEQGSYIALAEGDEALKPITDKAVRARPLQGRMQQHKVIIRSDQSWHETILQELLRFPGGVHDDIVDGMAWVTRMIINKQPPPKPNQALRGKYDYNGRHKSWKQRLNEMANGQNRPRNFMGR